MTDSPWENLKEIFHAALELSPHEGAAYLERVSNQFSISTLAEIDARYGGNSVARIQSN